MVWSIFVTFRDFGNKAKPARNAKLRKFEESDEKWPHSMAAADKWAREKDDFRKDSGSFCGSCTEWVRSGFWTATGALASSAAHQRSHRIDDPNLYLGVSLAREPFSASPFQGGWRHGTDPLDSSRMRLFFPSIGFQRFHPGKILITSSYHHHPVPSN